MSEHLDAAAMVREIDITGKQSARQDERARLLREQKKRDAQNRKTAVLEQKKRDAQNRKTAVLEQKKRDAQNRETAVLEAKERRMTVGDGFRFGVGFLLANMLFSAVALVLFVLLLLAGLVALPRIP